MAKKKATKTKATKTKATKTKDDRKMFLEELMQFSKSFAKIEKKNLVFPKVDSSLYINNEKVLEYFHENFPNEHDTELKEVDCCSSPRGQQHVNVVVTETRSDDHKKLTLNVNLSHPCGIYGFVGSLTLFEVEPHPNDELAHVGNGYFGERRVGRTSFNKSYDFAAEPDSNITGNGIINTDNFMRGKILQVNITAYSECTNGPTTRIRKFFPLFRG